MMISKLLQQVLEGDTATLPSGNANPVKAKPGPATQTTVITHFELARTLERANRRFASFLQAEMTRHGVQEIGPAHAMLLLTIGDDELSVGQLMDRGPYAGTNLSYYLKQLGEYGYIERIPLARDRRTARIRLSEKARQLCDDLTEVAAKYHRLVASDPEHIRNLEVAFETLDRLERAWASAAIFGAPGE